MYARQYNTALNRFNSMLGKGKFARLKKITTSKIQLWCVHTTTIVTVHSHHTESILFDHQWKVNQHSEFDSGTKSETACGGLLDNANRPVKNLLEVPMNMNPWIMEYLVESQRDRILRDIKQIRLEQAAMRAGCTEEKTTKARLYRPLLLMRIMSSLVRLSPLRGHTRKNLRLSGSTRSCRG